MLDFVRRAFAEVEFAVILTDADFAYPGPTVLYANAAASRLTGYDRQEMVGRSPRILQGPATTVASRKAMAQALRRGEPCQVMVKNYRKNGEVYDCEIEIRPIRDKAGEVIYAIAFEKERTRRPGRRKVMAT
ncbi:PAS domain-containing protein [Phenylobacterium sp.]|uniref:PAS domain-containing protein n=1 Tax=Phenylobacterium sp. TaxID=1871053 RepID=UPI002FDAAACC